MKATGIDGIYYHDRCPDGKGGSWVFWRENRERVSSGKMFMTGLSHGQLPSENLEGLVILIVDFCFPRYILEEMAKKARQIIILDHHKSAEKSLNGSALPGNISSVFDMKRSGAQIAWDYVYPNIPRPWFIDIIADRDLWKWTMDHSKEIGKGLSVKGWYTWENMEKMYLLSFSERATMEFKTEMYKLGALYMEQEEREISIICSSSILADFYSLEREKPYRVRIVGCPSKYKSEVGNRLCEKNPDIDFAVLWQYDFLLNEWWISCRGTGDDEEESPNIDLSKICSQFERGGGHPNSAGFTIFGSDRLDDSGGILKGENLYNYFKPLEVPKNRPQDAGLF